MDLVAILREAEGMVKRAAAFQTVVGKAYDGAPNKTKLKDALSVAHGSADTLAKAACGIREAVRGALGEALISRASAELGEERSLEVVQEALAPPRLKLLEKELAEKAREARAAELEAAGGETAG